MNAKIKQTLALVLALVLCLGLLAGCKGNEDPTTKPSIEPLPSFDNTSFKNSDTYPLTSDKTLTAYTGSAKLNEKYVSQFWKEVTGVNIDYIVLDTAQQNSALADKKNIPDIWMLHSRLSKSQVKGYGDEGLFIDFRDYLEIMPNVRVMFEKYPEALAMVQNDDGSIYALPQVGQKVNGLNPLSIRTDMLTAAGWTKAPATTDEFLQCIKDIQAHFGKDDPEFKAFHAYRNSYMTWQSNTHSLMSWFFPAFGELLETSLSVNKDGKVVFGANTEQFKNTLEYMNKLWTSGAFATTVYEEDGTQFRALVAQNKVASSLYMNTLTPENFASGKIELTICEPFTSTNYNEKHAGEGVQVAWMNNMISSKCPDIETACKWLDSFYAPKDNPLNEEGTIWGISFSLGEYGKHWTLDEESKTYTLHEVNGITTGNATNMVNLSMGWFDFPYVLKGDKTGTDVIAQGVVNNVLPYREPMTSYNLSSLNLTEDESDLYADTWTALTKYIDEMVAKFITGELDVNAKWSEYVNELDVLGLQDIINMYQTALNRTLKK